MRESPVDHLLPTFDQEIITRKVLWQKLTADPKTIKRGKWYFSGDLARNKEEQKDMIKAIFQVRYSVKDVNFQQPGCLVLSLYDYCRMRGIDINDHTDFGYPDLKQLIDEHKPVYTLLTPGGNDITVYRIPGGEGRKTDKDTFRLLSNPFSQPEIRDQMLTLE